MIIILNFICGPCGEGHHGDCASLHEVSEIVIKSHCDCQHREKAKPSEPS